MNIKHVFGATMVSLLLSGCGGEEIAAVESAAEEAARLAARPVSALAQDSSGALSEKTVWCDSDNDMRMDDGEQSAVTATDGTFIIEGVTQGSCSVIRVSMTSLNLGEDTSAFTIYSANSDSEVVSPLTTAQLVQEMVQSNNEMSVASASTETTANELEDQAESDVKSTLGLSTEIDLNSQEDMDLTQEQVMAAMQSAEYWIAQKDWSYSLETAHTEAHPEDNGGVGALTYVPDFTMDALGLQFTDVWVPDVADTFDSTAPVDLWFDVKPLRAMERIKVTVVLNELDQGNASDLKPNQDGFILQDVVHAFEIEELTTNEEKHVETSFTLPDSMEEGTYALIYSVSVEEGNEESAPVVEEPQGELLIGGVTEAVATTREYYNHVAGAMIVGEPDKTNLRVLLAEVENSSLLLNSAVEKIAHSGDDVTPSADIQLNLEVEAMAKNVDQPVNIKFDLLVDGTEYPLFFYDMDENGAAVHRTERVYDQQLCRVEEVAAQSFTSNDELVATYSEASVAGQECQLSQEGESYQFALEDGSINNDNNLLCGCATMVRQEPIGEKFNLYLSTDAKDELRGKEADYTAALRIRLDPENAVDEWNGNVSDNTKDISLAYLHAPEGTEGLARSLYMPNDIASTFPQTIVDGTHGDYSGNGDFAAGYNVGVAMAYRKIPGTSVPAAFYAGTPNWVKFKVFGHEVTFLDVGANLTVDLDDLHSTGLNYGVVILGHRIWGSEYGLQEALVRSGKYQESDFDANYNSWGDDLNTTETTIGDSDDIPIWDSTFTDGGTYPTGRQQYVKYKDKEVSARFWLGPVPIRVVGGAMGQLGLKGSLSFGAGNTFTLSAGPFASIDGYARGGIDAWLFGGGVGINLQVIEIANMLKAEASLTPTSNPVAAISFEAPFSLSSLDGRFYLYADWPGGCRAYWAGLECWREHGEKNIIHWNGYDYYHHWLPGSPYSAEWAPYSSDPTEQEWKPTSDYTNETVKLEIPSATSNLWLTGVGKLEGSHHDYVTVKDCAEQTVYSNAGRSHWWEESNTSTKKQYKVKIPNYCSYVNVTLKTDGSVTASGVKMKLFDHEPSASEYACSGFGC